MKYSTKEFAVASGVPGGTLRRWAVEGRLIPAERHGKKGNFYDESQIAEAQSLYLEKRPNAKLHIAEGVQNENVTADSAIVDSTATSAQNGLQALINAVADQIPANNESDAKIDDSASNDTCEENAEMSPTLVEENPAVVTIDVEAEIVTLEQRADRIRKLATDVQRGIIKIGLELIAAKAEIGHGNWATWLKENFEWTDRTAQNFMRVAQRFSKNENVFGFKPSTLIQMLALPVGSEDEFIAQQAESGKPVNEMKARDVQKAVKEFNQQRNGELEETADIVQAGKTENDDNTSDTVETNSPAEGGENAGDTSQKQTPPPITFNHNGSVEYYTPSKYIEAARRVMGSIDLDPASSKLANETVKAKVFYTKADDGLAYGLDWEGNVWMNPPYTDGLIDKFIYKMCESSVDAAIVLVPCRTDRSWFQLLMSYADAIVFTDHRVKCLRNGVDSTSGPTCGSAFFYLGNDTEKFFAEFEKFGFGVYPRKKNSL